MAVTVLSGTSGALYYKPAGTNGNFPETGVNAGTDTITVQPYLNFKAGDPVKFRVINSQTGGSGTGTLPSQFLAIIDRLRCARLPKLLAKSAFTRVTMASAL